MAIIKGVKGKRPVFGENCFLADNATVIGEVNLADHCSVWYNAVVRGDVCSIEVGENTNIQDGAVVHGTLHLSKTVMGKNVSIGHNAIIHGCTIEDNVLIGMGAIVMDNAIVREGAVVAAGAVVLANTEVEAGMLYAGTPAKPVKPVGEQLRMMVDRTPGHYIMYASWIED